MKKKDRVIIFFLLSFVTALIPLTYFLFESIVPGEGYFDFDYGRFPREEEGGGREKKEKEKGKIAVIIDDLGNSFERDKNIADIDSEITLAVLPARENSVLSAEYFSRLDRFELLLHLPLEPLAAEDREEKMIMTGMASREIDSALQDYLSELGDYVSGVNNHKGSKFTADREKMLILLMKIKEEGLFFVDSFTHKDSVAYELAKEMGIRTARRDIFLDNTNDKEEIRKKLNEAAELAERQGSAVVIGHSRPNTIAVLKEELSVLEKEGIRFVKISEVLE